MSNLHQVSFHDPEGSIFRKDHILIRRVSHSAGQRIRKFIESDLGLLLIKEKVLPATRELSAVDLAEIGVAENTKDYIWFEHRCIEFVSYPYEWTPEMLLDAGRFTLRLVQRLRKYNWDLKDASAYNVIFDGVNPVFVDLCSIVENSADPFWRPKAQFERHFVNPLIAYIYKTQVPHKVHFVEKDGLGPFDLGNLIGLRKWITKLGFFYSGIHYVLLHIEKYSRKLLKHTLKMNSESSQLASSYQLSELGRTLDVIEYKLPKIQSKWLYYDMNRDHYSLESILIKKNQIKKWISQIKPLFVIDIGSNTGEFSRIASNLGSKVIAIENDLGAARLGYLTAKKNQEHQLFCVVDITYPSPAMGWTLEERPSFDRRISKFGECLLALAILHHWVVIGRIPIDEIIKKLAQITKQILIIEFIGPADPMFSAMIEGRSESYAHINLVSFKNELNKFFNILEEKPLPLTRRTLFLCKLRG